MPLYSHLSSDERSEIAVFSAAGHSISVIARPGQIDNIAGTEAQSTSQGALFGALGGFQREVQHDWP